MTPTHTSEAPPIPQPKGWLARGFHEAIIRYLSLYVRDDDWLVDVRPMVSLAHGFKNYQVVHDLSTAGVATLPPRGAASRYWLLNGLLHYDHDVQARLAELSAMVEPDDRLIVVYYSSLWRPLLRMAGAFGWRMRTPEQSWISHSDVANFLVLSRFEPIRRDARLLCPIPIPGLAWFVNTMIAPLAFFRSFTSMFLSRGRPPGRLPPTLGLRSRSSCPRGMKAATSRTSCAAVRKWARKTN
jgi:hypothetical protein